MEHTPLFAFDSCSRTFERFDYPYDDLPLFTLECYPFHSVMHSDRATLSQPIQEISYLAIQWTFPFPRVGSFVLSPRVLEIIAENAAKERAAYNSVLNSTDSEDDDLLTDSDGSLTSEEPNDISSIPDFIEPPIKSVPEWLKAVEPMSIGMD